MAAQYKDQVEFLMIYIREAHAVNEVVAPINEREGIRLPSAETFEEKKQYATLCVRKLDIRFTTLIDDFDAGVEQAYAAHPDRIYLVGKDGRIVLKGARGPRGFRPEELREAIEQEIARN